MIIFFFFVELEASTSTGNIEHVQMDLIKQNFAQPNMKKLDDIEKLLKVNNKIYHLRGVINFFGGERSGLRSRTGHYTASTLRGNGQWETYDDTKLKVKPSKTSVKTDVEFLVYTLS
jgi:ubiquitin C-terminal hydrolase